MKTTTLMLTTALTFCTTVLHAAPNDASDVGDRVTRPQATTAPDYLFPRQGNTSLTATSGIPFLGMGEVAYGFSNRFAVGAIGGITPTVVGFGVRGRGLVFEREDGALRVALVVPVLYYPKTHQAGEEPWFLTNPTLRFESEVSTGWRLHAGLGLVAAACAESVFGMEDDGEEFMGGVWNTLPFGTSLRLSRNWDLFADAQLVLKGVRLTDEWVGGPPFTLALGVTTRL
jgi:hypothetical protein